MFFARPDVPVIDTAQAETLLSRPGGGHAVFVDIRDPASHEAGCIPGAHHVTNQNATDFLSRTSRDRPLVVYCYHGHSSLGAAAFFRDQGFKTVYSLRGGFAAWSRRHPVERPGVAAAG